MRPEKSYMVAELREAISQSDYLILTSYLGLSVAQMEQLRAHLLEAQARFHVVKNRLLSLAAEAEGLGINGDLGGGTAVVVGRGDVSEVVRVLREYAQRESLPEFKLGFADGRRLSGGDLDRLAQLPPRPVLLAQFVGVLQAPARDLAGVLHAKLASVVYVLKAAEDAKGNQEG